MTQHICCPNWQQLYNAHPKLRIVGRSIDTYNSLIVKDDRFKLELDSQEGQSYFKLHIMAIEDLITVLLILFRLFKYWLPKGTLDRTIPRLTEFSIIREIWAICLKFLILRRKAFPTYGSTDSTLTFHQRFYNLEKN